MGSALSELVPTSAHPGDTAEVGLRDKFGLAGRSMDVKATLVRPDGSRRTAPTILRASNWAYLSAPGALGPDPLTVGTYIVIWESPQGFIACDGFVVSDS